MYVCIKPSIIARQSQTIRSLKDETAKQEEIISCLDARIIELEMQVSSLQRGQSVDTIVFIGDGEDENEDEDHIMAPRGIVLSNFIHNSEKNCIAIAYIVYRVAIVLLIDAALHYKALHCCLYWQNFNSKISSTKVL